MDVPVLGVIQPRRDGGSVYCFEVPVEVQEFYGASPKSINVVIPSDSEKSVFYSKVAEDPEGNLATEYHVAVVIPEVRDIGVYLVALDEQDFEPLQERLRFLQAACGGIAFKNLGLRLVVRAEDNRGAVSLKPSCSFVETLLLAKFPELRGRLLQAPGNAPAPEKVADKAPEEVKGHGKVVVMPAKANADETLFEVLAPGEVEEKAGRSFAAIRAKVLAGADEGKEYFVWAKPTDTRSVSIIMCLQPGSRFTARVADRKDNGLLVECVAEKIEKGQGVKAQ